MNGSFIYCDKTNTQRKQSVNVDCLNKYKLYGPILRLNDSQPNPSTHLLHALTEQRETESIPSKMRQYAELRLLNQGQRTYPQSLQLCAQHPAVCRGSEHDNQRGVVSSLDYQFMYNLQHSFQSHALSHASIFQTI